MATFEINCTNCQTRLRVREEARGKKVSCPHCKQIMSLPASARGADIDNCSRISNPTGGITRNMPEKVSANSKSQRRDEFSPSSDEYDELPKRKTTRSGRRDDRDEEWNCNLPRKKRRRSKLVFLVLSVAGVLVLCVGVAVVFFLFASGANVGLAKDTVEEYFQTYAQKNWNKAISLYSEEFFTATSKEQWRQVLPALENKLGNYQSSHLSSWKYQAGPQGGVIVLAYQVQYAKGQATETFSFRGTTEAGRMLIVGHQINSPALLAPIK